MNIVNILLVLVAVFVIWAIVAGRPLFRSRHDFKATVQEAGQDLKEAGRKAADSISRAVK